VPEDGETALLSTEGRLAELEQQLASARGRLGELERGQHGTQQSMADLQQMVADLRADLQAMAVNQQARGRRGSATG
jgi:predicted  nucleic acid-binding Zn-ribbon protein